MWREPSPTDWTRNFISFPSPAFFSLFHSSVPADHHTTALSARFGGRLSVLRPTLGIELNGIEYQPAWLYVKLDNSSLLLSLV
jgi:hypothetical protein